MRMLVPYHKQTVPIEIDDARFVGSLVSKVESYEPGKSPEELVEASLDQPIGSRKLEELVKGKKNIVIISSVHTRPVPSKIITPILLRRIRSAQPDANIKILVATGFHRPSTKQELIDKYGPEIVEREQIVMHVSTDDSAMAHVGTLPSGGPCIVNRVAAEADLVLSQGFIEPHLFAGFSGGRKSVLPGIASYHTILANHCAEFINSPYTRPGILENNPIHKDIVGIVGIPRIQLLQDASFVTAVLVARLGIYIMAFLIGKRLLRLPTTAAALFALGASFPAAPFFGPAVLGGLFGASSAVAIAATAIIANLVLVPVGGEFLNHAAMGV